MRVHSFFLACLVLLVSAAAQAQTPAKIQSISPDRFFANSGEFFMDIDIYPYNGEAVKFIFSGPAGTYEILPNTRGGRIWVWVPVPILSVAGRYSVVARLWQTSLGRPEETTYDTPPYYFEVGNPPANTTPKVNVPPDITAEATGPNGAAVTFSVTGTGVGDDANGRPLGTANCSHASGAIFPLGTTVVTCTSHDPLYGTSASASFRIHVVDTTAPVLTLPRDMNVPATSDAGAVVTFSASARDLVDGSVAVSCTPASGSTFPIGTTGVRCTASDARANAASATFAITVTRQQQPPQLDLPDDITVEATGPNGAVVTYDAWSGVDDHNGRMRANCTPPSGSTFPLGATVVQCSAAGASGSFKITVVDTTAPVLTLPGNITTSEPVVTFNATAADLVDGSVSVVCTPASGSTFPRGTTRVQCSASDVRGNAAGGGFDVTVTQPATLPDITAEATSPGGAVVSFDVASTCAPASGSLFALGATTVSCSNGGTFKVTVVDTTAPLLDLPGDLTISSATGSEVVTFDVQAGDLVDGDVDVTCVPASGSTFPRGTTIVQCSAVDLHGNAATGSFAVTITDGSAPVFTSLTANPAVLQPANHRLVPITITAQVTDDTDPASVVRIFAVTANEAIDAPGSGNTDFDWRITGPLTLELRAERSGQGQDRIYSVHVEAIDAAGNRSLRTVTIRVPRDGNQETTPAPAVGKRRAAKR